MASPLVLERPGAWRKLLCFFILGLVFAPMLPLLPKAGVSGGVGAAFGAALGRSLAVAAKVSLLSLLLGLPLGALAATYLFRGQAFLLGLCALPLLVPSFLWAIGISELRLAFGTVLAFSSIGFSLVLWATFGAVKLISQGQADAARLIGGERALFAMLLREALPVATLSALFVGVWTLSDPGPGQILGSSGAASEILVSFSALYDFELAARQCLLLGGVVLLVVLPLASITSRRVERALLGRDQALLAPRGTRWSPAWVFGPVVALLVLLPLAGWIRPLFHTFPFGRAFAELRRTFFDSLLYCAGSGLTATLLGFLLAVVVGRGARARAIVFAVLLVAFSLPSSLFSLGTIFVSSSSPATLDFLLRSRFTVVAVQGLRFLPVAFLLAASALGASSPNWAGAAAIHGISLGNYAKKVLFPWLLRPAMQSFILVALLSSAEVSTVLMLRPPGEDSFPISIFTIMANAPESLVASLCLLYFLSAAAVLALAGTFVTRRVV